MCEAEERSWFPRVFSSATPYRPFFFFLGGSMLRHNTHTRGLRFEGGRESYLSGANTRSPTRTRTRRVGWFRTDLWFKRVKISDLIGLFLAGSDLNFWIYRRPTRPDCCFLHLSVDFRNGHCWSKKYLTLSLIYFFYDWLKFIRNYILFRFCLLFNYYFS